ncbi:MAG TPA: carboxylating nicotinate-nucleotide diphosphorylase [Pyrinomonadaceae bacterium]|jgi:nicotinate-nucleotide pyrophosphorylase (carboxylating)|nr:carboxylating nicotinate-nucleotide diphosphorylase [Pyrinomonadaceae bacterium]
MNWLDEGALFNQIGAFLSEDLGRGDITTQATVARNARARGRFLAKEAMVVAGLEAAEAVFSTLDAQQQIEAFASDGDEVEAGKVIARTSGFADVLLAGERVALNLMQRLSGIATLTRKYVRAVEGTGAQIVDTRKTTPGLRMLEKYAVLSGGGRNHRFGLDDGVLIKDNHIALAGGVAAAVAQAREKVGHLHKVEVEVSVERDLREAIQQGADIILLDNLSPEETARMVAVARELDPKVTLESSGGITLENVRAYAQAGVDLISIGALTHSARAMDISFKIQAG